MKNGNWGKEPFDFRLTVLRMLRCLPWILGAALAGTLLLGGAYYLKNIVFRSEKQYGASAAFLVEYADENWSQEGKYINAYSWNVWMQSDEFQGSVRKYLPTSSGLSGKDFGEMLTVTVPSDLRVVMIESVSGDPGEAQELIEAVKSAMVEDFPGGMKDVASIRVTDSEEAQEILPDVRPVRAFVLAAVVSLLGAALVFLFLELYHDGIYLPETMTNRYGLKSLALPGTKSDLENLRYFLGEKQHVAVCPVREGLDTEKFLGELKSALDHKETELKMFPCPVSAPETAAELRKMDGILLVVKAGAADSRKLGYVLDFLEAQDCAVTAAVLWEYDRFLLKTYYRLG